MLEILSLVIPFFAVIACGFFGARVIGQEGQEGINLFVGKFALPILLFTLMARANLAEKFQGEFLLAYAAVSVFLFVVTLWLMKTLYGFQRGENAVQSLASVYGNTGYMGIPVIVVMLGETASVPVVLALLTDIILMIPLASALVESAAANKDGNGKTSLMHGALSAFFSIFKNPLVIAAAIGAGVSLSNLPLPDMANRFMDLLGSAAAPCALFAMGSSLYGKPLGEGVSSAFLLSVLKLAIHPFLLFVSMNFLWQVDPTWSKPAIIAAGLPVAVTVYVVAREYRTAIIGTSTTIVISTLMSLISIPILISVIDRLYA